MASLLPSLFDAEVATAEADPFADPTEDLLPEESALLERAEPLRLLEFRAGRHCARVALKQLGASGPVLRAPDRSPIWPDGVIGSIAHTRKGERGFCGAAVARKTALRAIGIDVEVDVPLDPRLARRILGPDEAAWVETLGEAERGFWGLLVFSAKESVYKCQYPLSRKFLEFSDVEVGAPGRDGEFSATLMREAPPFAKGHRFHGRFVRRDGIVATAVTVAA